MRPRASIVMCAPWRTAGSARQRPQKARSRPQVCRRAPPHPAGRRAGWTLPARVRRAAPHRTAGGTPGNGTADSAGRPAGAPGSDPAPASTIRGVWPRQDRPASRSRPRSRQPACRRADGRSRPASHRRRPPRSRAGRRAKNGQTGWGWRTGSGGRATIRHAPPRASVMRAVWRTSRSARQTAAGEREAVHELPGAPAPRAGCRRGDGRSRPAAAGPRPTAPRNGLAAGSRAAERISILSAQPAGGASGSNSRWTNCAVKPMKRIRAWN